MDVVVSHAEFLTEHLGIPIKPADLNISIYTYDWLDFITQEQFDIVSAYLNIPDDLFDDGYILLYVQEMSDEALMYYDNLMMDETTTDPRRIITRMFEANALVNIELRGAPYHRFVTGLNRDVYDWR